MVMRRMKNLLLVGVLLLCHLSSLSARIIASGSCGANLTWTLADDGLLRISGSGDMNDFIIHHNDFSPWNGFEDYVKAIYIDSNVTSIGNYAFCGFNITSVTIPESVKSIGWGAFCNCCNLETITIPTGVVEIAPQTFRGCSSLSSVIVSQNLKLVGRDALEGTAWYNSQSDGLVYFNNILYEWKGEMPENTHIVVREGTVAIAEAAFMGCVNLNSITIPECVKFIGGSAFSGTMWYDNQPDGLIYINNVLYEYKGIMPQLMDIELKEGIVGISEYAFEDCENLASVTIPESVTMIGSQAFADCSSLRSIIIPKNVEHIGVNAFIRCSGLTTIEVAEGNSTYDSRDGCNAIIKTSGNTLLRGCTSTKIPNSVNYISFCALESCGFESIEIPEGVTSIGCQAFYGCANLTSVILPEGLISIGASAFHSCINLASIAFPESLNDIKPRALGGTAWYGKQSDGLVYINNILYGYKGTMPEKSSIAIKEGTVGICIDAFAEYKNLVSIVLPESVTSIGGNAFCGCSSLTAINIPKGVTSIGWGVFSGCSGLTTITCEATTPPAIVKFSTFGNVNKAIPVYVPAGSVEAYKSAKYWNEFTNIQPIEESEPIPTTITITINQYGSGTYSSEYALDFSEVQGLKAYVATGYNYLTGEVTLLRVRTAEAGTGLLIKGTPGVSYVVPVIESTADRTLNMLVATLEKTKVNGHSDDGVYANYKYTVVKEQSPEPLFYQFTDGSNLSAGKAYLQIPMAWLPATGQKALRYRFDEGETTDIDETTDDSGQSTVIYDLMGRRVASPKKGEVYIINNKKVVY